MWGFSFCFWYLSYLVFSLLPESVVWGLSLIFSYYYLKYFFLLLLLFLVFQWLAHFIFWNCPTVVECFFHSFSILYFILGSFWWPISSSLVFFPWLCWVYCWPIKGILHFCFGMLYIFPRVLNILINYLKIDWWFQHLCITESASNNYFVLSNCFSCLLACLILLESGYDVLWNWST